jgi:hypothetical protein
LHKAAYGTDKVPHGEEEAEADPPQRVPAATAPLQVHQQEDLRYLREQIDRFAATSPPTPEQLQDLRRRLAAIEAAAVAQPLAESKG